MIQEMEAVAIAPLLQVPYRTVKYWITTGEWANERAKEKAARAATVAGINLVLAHEKGNLAGELERLLLDQLTEARNLDPRVDALINDLEGLAREKGDSRILSTAFWALTRKHGLHLDMVKAVASLIESVAKLREVGQSNEGHCQALADNEAGRRPGMGTINPKCPLLMEATPEQELESLRWQAGQLGYVLCPKEGESAR